MRNIELKSGRKLFIFHILPMLLAVIIMFGSFAELTVFSMFGDKSDSESEGIANNISCTGTVNSEIKYDDTLVATYEGKAISELQLLSHEKKELIATGIAGNVDYQWQILHPEENGLWADIYDATENTISVSAALTKNMTNEEGRAYIRCMATAEECTYVTDVVSILICEEIKVEAPKYTAPGDGDDDILPLAEGDGDGDEHPEFVTITVEYEKYEYHFDSVENKYILVYMGPAFSSYVATLQYGTSFTDPISVPTIVGFQPSLVDDLGFDISINADGKLHPNIGSLSQNLTFKVDYKPAPVNYEVRYLFQNIYDDMYVVDTSINDPSKNIVNGVFSGQGYTGLPPSFVVNPDGTLSESDEKVGVCAEFEGFTALYYQPDTIAADGSTVFEVYFERNYYLMEFDCDGGYGAHTIYARHGTYVYVPTPTKMGYVLKKDGNGNYWDLVKNEDPDWESKTDAEIQTLLGTKVYDDGGDFTGFYSGNGTPNELPAVMPPYNTAYKVLWDTTDTTYTVVYWINESDGDQTYIGSRLVEARSATEVYGTDDLTADMNLCGLEAHAHGAGCTYACGKAEHTHSSACCTLEPHTHGATCCSIVEHTHAHNTCCDKALHSHNASCCSIVPHVHSDGCYKTTIQNLTIETSSITNLSNTTSISTYLYYRASGTNAGYYLRTTSNFNGNTYFYKIDGANNNTIVELDCTNTSWFHSHNYECFNAYNTQTELTCTTTEHDHNNGGCNTVNCANGGVTHTATDGTCNTNKCPNGGNEHTHGVGCNTENCDKIAHSSTHNDGKCVYCSTPEHNHATSGCRLSCGQEAHTHSDSCKVSDAAHYEFVDADGYGAKEDIIVDGDGSTVVNVYYKKKLYEIRYLYARRTSGGQYQIAVSTGGGKVGTDWSTTNVTNLPAIKAGLGFTQQEEVIGNYTYYYIAVRAEYGANIENMWPSNALEKIGNYSFGSWGAEYGSGYRGKDPAHANIVGPYPYMSAEMITAGNENLDPIYDEDTKEWYYVAQRMSAWWGGTSDNVSSHTYHIYYESLDGTGDRMYEGKWYKLADTHTFTAAHNTNTRVDPFFYNGFKCVNDTREHGYDHQYDYQRNSSLYSKGSTQKDEEGHLLYNCPDNSCSYCNCFYYDRVDYQFALYNYNALLNLNQLNVSVESASWTDTPFGEELFDFVKDQCENKFDPTNNPIIQDDFYPNGIEPGAYEFGGWYTTPACYDGTEVDWDTLTMPDGNLTLYAKWTPIMRNVYFHLLYTDINYDDLENSNFWYPDGLPDAEKEDYYPIEVSHGELLGTTYSHTPERVVGDEEYIFIGWFYFDENGKKKFAPDSMKVTRDLILFAEWFSTAVTTYNVQYKAYKYVDGINDELIDDEIAKPLDDYSSAGKTVTFNAKGGSALYDEDPPGDDTDTYQENWFPHTSSHSILMDADSSKNTFEFKYYYKAAINYKVMYINRIDGTILGESEVKSTSNAVVTERFRPYSGFIPEEYYIKHPVAYDPVDYNIPGNEKHVSDENIIYFYYVPDTEHALHRIEHYQQNITDNEYTLYTADQGPHDIGDEKNAKSLDEGGFELVKIEIYTYHLNDQQSDWIEDIETIDVITEADREKYIEDGISRIVTLGGLGIKFYYDRIYYSYTVNYVEDVDASNVLWTSPEPDRSNPTTQQFMARFGATVSYTAVDSYENVGDPGDDGLIYIHQSGLDPENNKSELRTQSRKITSNESENLLTFLYYKKKTQVYYKKVCNVEDLTSLNAITFAGELVASPTEITGSKATAGKGFTFVGWFKDEACTVAIDDPTWYKDGNKTSQHLMPKDITDNFDGVNDDVITFYAKFEPICGSLKITKSGVSSNDLSDHNFLFRIKGKDNNNKHIDLIISIEGNGTEDVLNVPIGDYTVTELTEWSWDYTATNASQNIAVAEGEKSDLTFDNTDQNPNWLYGEVSLDNLFN